MSNYATRDATFILTESNNWTAWYRQLKIRCESLNIWALADPEGSQEPKPKSRLQLPLVLSNYESIATLPLSTTTASSSRTRGNTQLSQREEPVVVDIPTRVSDLTTTGQEEHQEYRKDYKMRIETYRFLKKEYNEEHAKYEKLLVYILGTVSSHLQLSCCYTGNSVREWIKSLQETVGVDPEEERIRV